MRARTAHLPRARRAVSAAHRGVRQARAGDQRHRRHQPAGARRGRRSRSPLQGRAGPVGPLHCVPAIVKDNFETIGLQSADGSLSLKGSSRTATRSWSSASRPPAPSSWPSRTWRSSRSRRTRPSARSCRATRRTHTRSIGSPPDRAAARRRPSPRTSAPIGLGSDTGNSIRGPASHQALVGIRSTMGLTSRSGRRSAQPARRHRRTDDAHARRRGRRVSGDRRARSRRSGDCRRHRRSPGTSAPVDTRPDHARLLALRCTKTA